MYWVNISYIPFSENFGKCHKEPDFFIHKVVIKDWPEILLYTAKEYLAPPVGNRNWPVSVTDSDVIHLCNHGQVMRLLWALNYFIFNMRRLG